MNCRCAGCSTTPSPTYLEAHRHACEVRHVAQLPSKEHRKRYVRGVANQRGAQHAQAIIDGLKAMSGIVA